MNSRFLVQQFGSKSGHWNDVFESEDISIAKLFCSGLLNRIDKGRMRLAKVDVSGRILWTVTFSA